MASKETKLIIAYFNSFPEADAAAKSLKGWDKANDDIKLGAIGVLHQDDKGKIKTKKYGQHNTGSGAKIGLLLGVLAAVLPAVTLVGGVVAGATGGGILGSFSRKGLGLSSGKAALAVLAAPDEASTVSAQLSAIGGSTEELEAPPDEIEQVATEVNAPAPDEVEGAAASAS
jgi:uncharacterized membrane protein